MNGQKAHGQMLNITYQSEKHVKKQKDQQCQVLLNE